MYARVLKYGENYLQRREISLKQLLRTHKDIAVSMATNATATTSAFKILLGLLQLPSLW
jgi:hypothetical protein